MRIRCGVVWCKAYGFKLGPGWKEVKFRLEGWKRGDFWNDY